MMRINGRRTRSKTPMILLGAWLAALALLFGKESFTKASGRAPVTAAELKCPGCNVLLLTIDCLRASEIDRVGESGRKVMPNLARFAAKSLDFINAYSPAIQTVASNASIMTGLYPLHHAVLVPLRDWRRQEKIYANANSLPGLLKRKGWDLRYLTLGWSLDGDRPDPGAALPSAGERPFFTWVRDANHEPYLPGEGDMRALYPSVPPDSYPHRKDIANCEFMRLLAERTGEKSFRLPRQIYGASRASRILRMRDPRQKLLAVRNFDPIRMDSSLAIDCFWHFFDAGNGHLESDLYDAKAHEIDERFGRLLRDLRRRGDMDKTIIVVTSQHGAPFTANGLPHNANPLAEVARVILLVHVPKLKSGRKVDTLASLVDIEPTLLDSLGFKMPKGLDGKSLIKAVLSKDRDERFVFSFARLQGGGSAAALVVRDRRFTYMKDLQARREAFFDRLKDPDERHETTGLPPEAAARLRAALKSQFFGGMPQRHGDWPPWAGPEMRKRLIRTGYW